MLKIYKKFSAVKRYSVDSRSIGERSLKNIALRYLSCLDEPEWLSLALYQFEKAANMTDRLSSLALLCDRGVPEKTMALREFYEKWKHDPLVMNKWFAVQASAKKGDVLAEVLRLEKDPAFDRKNPNKQRALYGVFAGNLVHFHERSGKGYAFMAEKVLEIDQFNPGAAAKLAGAFKKYSQLDPPRKVLMKRELQRILKTPGLSRHVYEIISKTLKA